MSNLKSRVSNPKSVLLLAVLVVLVATPAFGVFSKVGTVAAPFLKVSVGRPVGMGDAFVGLADDASASYYNPAGLAQLGEREVFLNHIAWIAGMNHEYVSGILPVRGIGTVAVSVTALGSGDIEQTSIDDPSSPVREDSGTGLTYSGSDLAVGVSYARLITDKLAFGATVKGITQTIWEMTASGVGLDVGLLYNTGWRNLRVGAAVANFGSDLSFSGINLDFIDSTIPTNPSASYNTTPAPLPITFRFGLAYDWLKDANNSLVMALDLVHPSDINETVNVGFEYALKNSYFLRAGYILNTDAAYARSVGWQQGLSAGAGIAFKPVKGLDLKLDYGYRNQGYMGATHRVTLGVLF